METSLTSDGGIISYSNGKIQLHLTTIRSGDYRQNGHPLVYWSKMGRIGTLSGKEGLLRLIPRHDCEVAQATIHLSGIKTQSADAAFCIPSDWFLFGLIHCSWLTLRDGIIEKSSYAYGFDSSLKAIIYQGICQDCYEVGHEVLEIFRHQDPDYEKHFCLINSHLHLDLSGLIREKLIVAGLRKENIKRMDICSLHSDFSDFNENSLGRMLYSHRKHNETERNLIIATHQNGSICLAGSTGNCPYAVIYK